MGIPLARLATLAILALAGGVACQPVRGLGKKPVDHSPLPLADAGTGAPIEDCLVIGVYERVVGASTALGEGPSVTRGTSFLAHPFIYRRGQAFRPIEGGGGGVAVLGGAAGVGAGWGINGVVILARGYRPRFVFNLRNGRRLVAGAFSLTAMEPAPSNALRVQLAEAFSRPVLDADSANLLFEVQSRHEMRVEFDRDDVALVRSFLGGSR